MRDALTEKATDAWYRELNNGRIEVMCRAPNFRLRVTAPETEAWEAVEMFERWTNLSVECDRRPRRTPRQMDGQLSMMDVGPAVDNGD